MASPTREYVSQILRRSREPMEPVDFDVDWGDAPTRHKVYLGCERIELPRPEDGAAPWWGVLTTMLRQSYAMIARRTRVTPNTGSDHQQSVDGATFGRGSASGGGMYPVELYLVVGPGQGVVAGLYHYSTAHDGLDLLLAGDYRGRVRAALRSPEDDGLPPYYVLGAVRFWKNAFKYNSFSYHVVTTDIGTLFGAWQAAASDTGPDSDVRVRMWFDETDLDGLLGLDPMAESVFAVVTVGPAGSDATTTDIAADAVASVDMAAYERSRRLITFDWVEQVQADMLADTAEQPATIAPVLAAAPAPHTGSALPRSGDSAVGWESGLATARRKSSFGLFSSGDAMGGGELAQILDYGLGSRLVAVGDAEEGPAPLAGMFRLSVFANHIEGVAAGAYDYDAVAGALHAIPGDPLHPFLQYNYYLSNYNLEQPAAVIAVSGAPELVVDDIGPRGFRLVNAELGAVAQRLYLAAAALDLGCGAVFGFDNVSIQERLGRADSHEWPMLLVMVGPERAGAAQYHYRMSTTTGSVRA